MSSCNSCGARLSRYAPVDSVYCAACEPELITHAEYVLSVIHTQRDQPDEACVRGHDLTQTGVLRNTGHGRITRKCRACDAIRQATYRQRKAAA
jgi:hypothetical protein